MASRAGFTDRRLVRGRLWRGVRTGDFCHHVANRPPLDGRRADEGACTQAQSAGRRAGGAVLVLRGASRGLRGLLPRQGTGGAGAGQQVPDRHRGHVGAAVAVRPWRCGQSRVRHRLLAHGVWSELRERDPGGSGSRGARPMPPPGSGASGLQKVASVVQGDLFEVPLAPQGYDAAVLGFLLSHLTASETGALFERLRAILRPRAQVAVLDSAWSEERRPHRQREGFERRTLVGTGARSAFSKKYSTQADLEALLREQGFQVQSTYVGKVFIAAAAATGIGSGAGVTAPMGNVDCPRVFAGGGPPDAKSVVARTPRAKAHAAASSRRGADRWDDRQRGVACDF